MTQAILDLAPFKATDLLEQDRQKRLQEYAARDIVRRSRAGRGKR